MSTVTVILPTYNRATFLPDAFASIAGQSFVDWNLVVVDDGSKDDTRDVVESFIKTSTRPVKYVAQANQGAYGARNTGLAHASTPYVAFFDSDDLWLPHHLEHSIAALEANPDVDWVFSACRRVDSSDRIIDETAFEVGGSPRPFTQLRHERRGTLNVITDPQALECHFRHGIFAGLQNSVLRRALFQNGVFYTDSKVVEDALFLARSLLSGARLAFLEDVHVIYRIHDSNSTVANPANNRAIFLEQIAGLERLARTSHLNGSQRRAFNFCLARHYFWHLGYVTCWTNGDTEGLSYMRKGLALTPLDVGMWKTYVRALALAALGMSGAPSKSAAS